jgi:lysophospholipase L1-like esterase
MDISIEKPRTVINKFALIILLLSVLTVNALSQSASPRVNHSELTQGDPVVIVAFGNSITAVRKTVQRVFAQRLPYLLEEHGLKAKVINAGIGGSHTGHRKDHDLFKIPHALDRFDTAVLKKQPDLTIIGFGTNDSYIDSKVEGGPSRIPLSDYQQNLEYMIEQLKAEKSHIILMAPNLLGGNYPDFQNERLLLYVKTVRKLARKYRTGLVDNYTSFIRYARKEGNSLDDLLLDGVHPNDRGHELIATNLANEVLRLAKKQNNFK